MSLVKRSGVYLGSNILNALVPFLLLPVLTRYLTTGEYGQIAMFQTLVTGLSALMGLNTIGAANRKYYDADVNSLPSYNGACVQILFATIMIVGLVSWLLADKLSLWLSIPSTWVYISVAISSANFLVLLRLGQWQVREMPFKFGIMQVSQSVVIFVFSIILIVLYNHGAEGRVIGLCLATILYALISVFLLYKDRLVKIATVRMDFIKDALAYGVPLVPHVIGIFFLSSVDRFFINKELGISEAGIYMFAVQLSLGVAVVFDAINKALVTWLFKSLADNKTKQIKKILRFTYLFFVIVLCLGILSFVIGPVVVNIVGGDRFSRAGEVIGWLCLGQAFGGMYLMVTNYVFYARKTGLLSLVTISTGIINVFLLFFMLKYNGITGVAMAFAISMLLRFIGTWLIAIKVTDFSWRISFLKSS